MRRKVFAWVTGSNSRHLLILSMGKVLSIFVDESGRFQFPDTNSEMRLFGGPRDFKRNILKKIKVKEI